MVERLIQGSHLHKKVLPHIFEFVWVKTRPINCERKSTPPLMIYAHFFIESKTRYEILIGSGNSEHHQQITNSEANFYVMLSGGLLTQKLLPVI